MTEQRWDCKQVYEYTLDDAIESWCDVECSIVADAKVEEFRDELATLRAKAAAWDEMVQRLRTACKHHIGRESLHRAGQVVIEAVNAFTSKDHSDG